MSYLRYLASRTIFNDLLLFCCLFRYLKCWLKKKFFREVICVAFSLLIILFADSSLSRFVDRHISSSCKILLTLYAFSIVGEVVALASQ